MAQPLPPDPGVHALFEAQARKTPDATAVIWGGTSLTYRALDLRAEQLARALIARGVGPNQAVALCLERSLDLPIAVLGILKAGGAYLPLDPEYPAERLAFMLEDSAPQVLITEPGIRLPPHPAEVLTLAEVASEAPSPRTPGSPSDLAYILYTSGSTGRPKGVMMEHRPLLNLLRWQLETSAVGAGERTLQFAPISFDVSFQEMFSTWAAGGALVLIPDELRLDGKKLIQAIDQHAIARLFLPFIALEQLAEAAEAQPASLRSLREIITAGEALKITRPIQQLFLRNPACTLFNHYGPTECHVVTSYRLEGPPTDWPALPPIGKAIANTRIYLLDEGGQPVKSGEAGELHIGGEALARGYLHRPELTEERFLRSPLGRLYKTGDLAKERPDGNIEFLGRIDGQVKLRGYRIELGEVEVALGAHPEVQQAVAVVREDQPGDRRLVAYVAPKPGQRPRAAELRQHLVARLPDYMIPSAFVAVSGFPKTPSGKIDRQALPAPSKERPDLDTVFVAPANPREEALAAIWRELLQLDRIGVHDNFFDLGGNSLLSLKTVARLRERASIEVSVVRVYQHPTIRGLLEHLDGQGPSLHQAAEARAAQQRGTRGHTPIAIIGMAGRFPGARDLDALWSNLVAGNESVRFFSEAELDTSLDTKLIKDPAYVKARGVIEDAGAFDAAFFGVNPRLAEVMDPQQRIFLELAWSALESAGIDPARAPKLVGVYAGMGNNSYFGSSVLAHPERIAQVGDFQTMVANEKDYVATLVSHKLNLGGPSLSIHTACSTSLVAIGQAVRALRGFDCDLALAGGVSVTAPENSGYLYQEGGMLSADGHTRSFDAKAAGTVFSDGAGIVVLKRLEDAQRDGDRIHAVILGVGINNDGADKASFTAPSVEGQAGAIAMAQADAGIDPRSIGYIETHGTATPLGDPIEIEALTRAFRGKTEATGFCAIGSIKSNFGHLTAAAGVAGLIKSVLALEHRLIPPSLHFERPNPAIDFGSSPFFVNTEARRWASDQPRRAAVSSFGVGGTNAHLILEEAPPARASGASRAVEVLPISARDEAALERATKTLARHLAAHPELPLGDVAYTLALGRKPFRQRRFVLARDTAEAARLLGSGELKHLPTRLLESEAPPVTFMFPGQGSQYLSMGATLAKDEPVFAEALERCFEILGPTGEQLRKVMHPATSGAEATALLSETRYTQPALFIVGYALAEQWTAFGVRAEAMIGHSIGEFVAATLAGVMSLEDALGLVVARGQLMQDLPRGAMLSVRMAAAALESRIPAGCSVAAINGPALSVVAGPTPAIEAFAATLEAEGVVSRRLHTSHAFHSPMMDPIVAPFAERVRKIALSAPKIRFVSTVTADWITDGEATDPMYWARHLRVPVRFADGVRTLWQKPERVLLELGPGGGATTLARQQAKGASIALPSLGGTAEEESSAMGNALGQLWMAGVPVDWDAVFAHRARNKLALPTYPFERSRYWLDPGPAKERAIAIAIREEPPAPRDHRAPAHPAASATPLLEELRTLLEDTSGIDLEGVSPTTTFFEMGLDSLFLTQVALSLGRKYGTKITFRQLLEDLSSIEALAEFIAEQPRVQPVPGQLTDGAPQPAAAQAALPSPPPAEKPKPFGAQAKIDLSRGEALSAEQQAFVDRFIARYNQRTMASKAFTEAHRGHLADPRVVTGFRPPIKELIYQVVVGRSKGSRVWDLDGNEYIDVLNGFGSSFLGHGAPFVTAAAQAQLEAGIELGPMHPLAGETAKLICEMTGFDRAAFCNTGSEAVMGAMRIARTVTGRSTIAVFAGSYHGIFDEVIIRAGRNLRTIPAAAGIMPEAVQNMLVLDYGTPESLEILKSRADELAAVLIEPVQSRRPDFHPREFLHEVRALTERSGAVMIFDEVITGFRTGPGGAQSYYGLRADLGTYGKVIGGGMPIGVIAGKTRFMDALDGGAWRFGDASAPEVGVTYFAGTFCRHPLALATTKAVLEHLFEQGPSLQENLNQLTGRLIGGVNEVADQLGVPIHAVGFGSLFKIKYVEEQPFGDLLFPMMRERGIHILDSFPCFLTTAHTEADVQKIIAAFKESALELQAHRLLPGGPRPERQPVAPGVRAPVPIERRIAPATDAQREILAAVQMGDDANCAYNESATLKLKGTLDQTLLSQALTRVVQRHEALRTRFSEDGADLLVADRLEIPLPLIDLSREDAAGREAGTRQVLHEEVTEPFDVYRGPLFRAKLLRLEAREHWLVITAHHAVCDGWSLSVLLHDLADAYADRERIEQPAPKFSDYALKEALQQKSAELAEAERYWLGQFQRGSIPVLDLPTDRPRPAIRTSSGARYDHVVDPALQQRLKKLGGKLGCSFVTTVLAGFNIMLYRLSGQTDLVVGLAAAGQAQVGQQELVGHCVNMLPLRSELDPEMTVAEYLARLRGTMLDAYEHQQLTFGALLKKLTIQRDPSRIPLVPVSFNIDPGVDAGVDFPGLELTYRSNPRAYENFEIFLNAVDSKGKLVFECSYNTDLFEAATIERWMHALVVLLEAIAADPDRRIADLSMLPASDQAQLLRFNETERAYPKSLTIDGLIARQVARTPDRVALVQAGESGGLSYQTLEQRSNQLAHHLIALGVVRGAPVGICMERTPELVIGLLGVLKAGAAYVPIDPDHPEERNGFILANAGAMLVLSESGLVRKLPVLEPKAKVLALDAEQKAIAARPIEAPVLERAAEDAAYLIYTSGSTGKPKGVAIPHRAVVNFLSSMAVQPGIGAEDVLLALTTLSFDIAGLELLLPLTSGAKVAIAGRAIVGNGARMVEALARSGATVVQATPAAFTMMMEAGWAANPRLKVLVGGEALPRPLANQLLERAATVFNMYGPTETTIWSTMARVEPGDGPIVIGKPIANTRVWVLDGRRQSVPIGVPGELYIGGDGVALGYVKLPELTAERFIPEPGVEGRMYRTGDRVRLRADGNLEYLNRLDHQVKLRGFRIELGEIESVLAEHPALARVVAIVREDRPGDRRLVAYYLLRTGEGVTGTELRKHLRARLPEYMIPQHFVELDQIQMTPNLKIDRKSLPPVGEIAPTREQFVAPRTEAEKLLAKLWQDALGVKQVGVGDNFFALGGHSLLSMRVLYTIEKTTGARIHPREMIFQNLGQLATLLEAKGQA